MGQDSYDNLIKQDIHFPDDDNYRGQNRQKFESESGNNIQGTVYDTVVDTKRNSNFRSSAADPASQKNQMSYLMLFYFMLICWL